MATIYGVNATKRDNTNPPIKIPAAYDRGRHRLSADWYIAPSTIANGTVLELCQIPAGATVWNCKLMCPTSGGSGSTGTVTLGWEAGVAASGADSNVAANSTGLIASQSIASSASITSIDTGSPAIGFFFGSTVRVVMNFTAVTTQACSIYVTVDYTLD